jgi:hypothetical protein
MTSESRFGPSDRKQDSMMNDATIPTWDLLSSLGFQPDSTLLFSDIRPGLSLDFGNLNLSAVAVVSPYSGEIISFSGVLSTPRTVAEIQFELPRRLESLKQCAAWIVWNLDQYSDRRLFKAVQHVGWIEEGRQNQKLLPWVAEMAAYRSRPQCTVRRDWLRLALKTLGEHLVSSADDTPVLFSFDGSVLSIRCDGKVVVLPGDGLPWTVHFTAQCGKLRRVPKRFMHEHIEVSIWESRLRIDGSVYEGTIEASGVTGHGKVQ